MSRDAVDSHHIPLVTKIAFMVGAFLSITTIAWSILRAPELPLPEAETARLRAQSRSPAATLAEIVSAIREMPTVMRDMALMSLFQWYGMACYWGYIVYSISRSLYGATDPKSAGFREAVLSNGQAGAFYNLIAFGAAFAMAPLAKRFGAKPMHVLCLTASGVGMLFIPHVHEKIWLFAPMIGVGLGWASVMGNPYVMLANGVPPERTGVYMGVFNMFIVIPMLLIAATLPLYYKPWLGGDGRNVITLAGVLMICAAAATSRIRVAADVLVPAAA